MKHQGQHGQTESGGHYKRLAAMVALSYASMYALMYAMVNVFENVLPNVNQLYMAALMTGAMVIIELVLMGGMYPNKRVNAIALGLGAAVLVATWLAIRQQALVSDRQFLKSMIPHHAGAILMCEEAPIGDPEIKQLCRAIVSSQQAEIDQMKAKLEELERR
jgi:uncharacterized protein (DUF305 family)